MTTSEDIVKEVFKRASAQDSESDPIKVMPWIHPMALDRKKIIDERMMNLKKLKPELRFQVRNGETDLKLLVKEYFRDDYSNYLEFKLQHGLNLFL